MPYPTSIQSFTFKRNNIDKVVADDVNSAYTEITEIERQLGGVASGGIGVTTSTWGTGTFVSNVANWLASGKDGLAERLTNIEAGLYQALVTGSIRGTTIPSSKTLVTTDVTSLSSLATVNGTTIPSSKTLVTTDVTSLSSLATVNGTTIPLNGTLLTTTTGTTSVLTSVGTLTNLLIGASAGSTAPLKLTSGTNLGTTQAGAIEYDGKALYFTPSTSTGRAVVQSTNYYTYYGNSGALGGATAPYGFKRLTVAANTAYEYEGMYVFSFNEVGSAVSTYPKFQIQGTATIANSAFVVTYWCATGGNYAAQATARTMYETYAVGNTAINLENTTNSSSTRVGVVKWKGILRNEQASTGTVYASILGNALSTVTEIKDSSYIKLTPIGVDNVAVNGAWT